VDKSTPTGKSKIAGPHGNVKPGVAIVRQADTSGRISLRRFGVIPGQRYRVSMTSAGVVMLVPTEAPCTKSIDSDDMEGGESS